MSRSFQRQRVRIILLPCGSSDRILYKRYLHRQESGPYLTKSIAHHKMALRCLSYLQFSCFEPELTDDDVIHYIGNGSYIWLPYSEKYWLQHVRMATKVDTRELRSLARSIRTFLNRWARDVNMIYSTCPHVEDFGLAAFKEISSKVYQAVLKVAFYKVHGRRSEYSEGNFIQCFSRDLPADCRQIL
jgi:hypothetical protein